MNAQMELRRHVLFGVVLVAHLCRKATRQSGSTSTTLVVMTDTIKGNYWTFYLMGRGEKRLLKHDIDLDALATKLLESGGALRPALAEAVAGAGKPLEVAKARRKWLDEHAEQVKDAGGDQAGAYGAWCQGRVDELTYALEEEFVLAMADATGEEDGEELPGGDLDEDHGDDEDDEEAGDD